MTAHCRRNARRAAIGGAFAVFVSVFLFPQASLAGDNFGALNKPYQQGRGFQFADGKFSIGGYTSFRYLNASGEKPVIDLRDVSFLINWRPRPRWRLFSEAEIGEVATITSGEINADDASFDLERLYAEYAVSPELKFRFGKSLTPIGYWNMVHAAPLVWSVTRPWTSVSPFARHTTGANVNGVVHAGDADFDYTLFVDDSDDLDPDRKDPSTEGGIGISPNNNFDNGYGLRLVAHLRQGDLNIGLSLGSFRLAHLADRKDFFGLDAIWQAGDTELSAAAIYRASSRNERDEWGAYVQVATPIVSDVYLFARHEQVRNALPAISAKVSNIGLNFHPIPPVSLKLEYRYGHNNDAFATDAWLASFDVLF